MFSSSEQGAPSSSPQEPLAPTYFESKQGAQRPGPRGYVQRGAETFSNEARQMLFRFMVESREETLLHSSNPAQVPCANTRPIVEDQQYLAGFHELGDSRP